MEQQIVNLWKGYVRIRITGNSYDRFLNLCAFHGVRLWNLIPSGDSYEANIGRKDFKKLKAIVRKSHAAVCITQKHGFPFFIHKYRKRKVYVSGIAAAVLFMVWLSAHIWNITIEGNVSQTDDVIFEYLTQEGIIHGMRKSEVDCRALASEIRNYFTQFSWVAAELKGTRLIIHVREGILGTQLSHMQSDGMATVGEIGEDGTAAATDLIASAAGTVESVYVRHGLALVKAGDAVEKGEILVSGALPVKDDGGEICAWQYTDADADIVIRTERRYRDCVELVHTEKKYTGREKKNYLLRIGNQPFSLPDTFGAFENCTILSEITQLQLMENFYLPVYVQKFTAKEYENEEILYTKEQASEILKGNFQYFMKNLEEKGVQIFENDVKIEWNEKSAVAAGILTTGEAAVSRAVSVQTTKEELLEHEHG